jgi:membrane protein involved in colicin uptake
MGTRDQMRNLELFRVETDVVNEFEYQKNQGELTEQREHHSEQQDSPSAPETEAERIEQVIADAHAKVEKRKRKAKGAAGTKVAAAKKSPRKSTKKAGAKKSAAKKSAVKSAAKKSASKLISKKTAKKSAAKKSAARKTATKKAAARKPPARKTGGRRR